MNRFKTLNKLLFKLNVIKGVVQLALTLAEEREDHLRAAAAWALGQIGRHTPEHAKAVALANVLPKLLEWYLKPESTEDLQQKVF
jgi:3-methyladenine DNA glycosylase AlkD